MDDSTHFMHLGNLAYNRDDWSTAVQYYTLAINSKSLMIRSDAYLNRALAYQNLGLIQHKKSDMASAVEIPYKNPNTSLTAKDVLSEDSQNANESNSSENNDKKVEFDSNSDKKCKEKKKSLADCFPGEAFFMKCSELQKEKDKNSWQQHVFMERSIAFKEFGDYFNAMQDAQTGLTLAPQNTKFWELKAKLAYKLNQTDTAIECANIIEQQNCPMSKLKAKCACQKKNYQEAFNEINKTFLTDKESGRNLRSSFNKMLGNISNVLYDEPTHPLSIFATRELPKILEPVILNKSPYLEHLMYGILNTFRYKSLYDSNALLPDLGIDINVQVNWLEGSYKNIKHIPPKPINFEIQQHKIPKNFAPKLIEQALMIGSQMDSEHINLRRITASGLAILEISQLIRKWIHEKSNENITIIPSFDLILSITLSWLRFIDPSIPIFPRKNFSKLNHELVLVNGSVTQDQKYSQYVPKFAYKIKEKLVRELKPDSTLGMAILSSNVNKPETILNITKTGINVKIPSSNSIIYLKPSRFGTYNMGIVFDPEENKISQENDDVIENIETEKYDKLAKLWISLLNNSSTGEPTKEIFNFLYQWMIFDPITNESTSSCLIIFSSILHSLFGYALDEGSFQDIDIRLEALLAKDLDGFINSISKDIKLKQVGFDFESIIDTLPDMQYRTAILLDVPEVTNLRDYNPQKD